MFITDKPIRLEDFFTQKPNPSCGAIATFVGVVRNHHQGSEVKRIYYECYQPMANKEIERIVGEVKSRTKVDEIRVLHRIGWLEVGDVAVAIWVSAAHREEAFLACRSLIGEIKQKVPIWKREVYTDGTSEWVLSSGSHAERGSQKRNFATNH